MSKCLVFRCVSCSWCRRLRRL